jgi:hypothetical protein
VLKKIPDFISENIDKMFDNDFRLFQEFSNKSEAEENRGISEYIQKNILNIETKKKKENSYSIPGQVRFENSNLSLNFKTLNMRNYSTNEALVKTLVDLSQISQFNNSVSSYYYSSLAAYKQDSKNSIQALKKVINQADFDAESHPLRSEEGVNKLSYKKKYIRVVNTNPRNRLTYLQRLVQMENRYPDLCKSFLSNLSSIIQKKNKIIINEMIINPKYLKFLGLNESQIKDMYHEFFYSEINDQWFKQETFLDDKIFKISCEVLSFLSIKNLTNIKNYEILEIHLKSSIDMLKELDFTFALEYKFAIITKVLENISYLIHYVNETKVLPGNEEILVVFIWCVIQSKCETMKSNFRFLQLFVNDDQKMGELGFAITQLEAAIIYIGRNGVVKVSLIGRKYFEEFLEHGEL